MVHQPEAGLVAELLREQRIEQRHDASEHVREHRESELDREQPPDPVEQPARHPLPSPSTACGARDQRDDLVDDQLADIERCDRQQRARDPQQRLTERQRTAGPPDQLQERREVAQRSQALPPRAAILSRQAVAGAAASPRGRRSRSSWAYVIVPKRGVPSSQGRSRQQKLLACAPDASPRRRLVVRHPWQTRPAPVAPQTCAGQNNGRGKNDPGRNCRSVTPPSTEGSE